MVINNGHCPFDWSLLRDLHPINWRAGSSARAGLPGVVRDSKEPQAAPSLVLDRLLVSQSLQRLQGCGAFRGKVSRE